MAVNVDWADYLQRFSTKVLWHFTGYHKNEETAFQRLLSIAKDHILKISKERYVIKMPGGENRYGHRASCMCDIPFRDLQIHIARYGFFGVAFNKGNAVTRGHFNPVVYLHKDHIFFTHAAKILPEMDRLKEPHQELAKLIGEYLTLLGTYVKVSDLTAPLSFDHVIDEEQKNNFYYEREWRSAYDWNFGVGDVAAIMIPKYYIKRFKDEIKGSDGEEIFLDLPIISTEMVNAI